MVTRIKKVKLNLLLSVMFVSLIGIFVARNLLDQFLYGLHYWMDFIIYFVSWGISLYIFDFFKVNEIYDKIYLFKKIVLSFFASLVMVSGLKAVFLEHVFIKVFVKNVIFLFGFIILVYTIQLILDYYDRKNILIVGNGKSQRAAGRLIHSAKHLNFNIKGYVALNGSREHLQIYKGDSIKEDKSEILRKYKCLGKIARIESILEKNSYDLIIIDRNEKKAIRKLLDSGMTEQQLLYIDEIFETLKNKIPVLYLDDIGITNMLKEIENRRLEKGLYRICKRLFAITFSTVALLITSPVILLSALIIKLESSGPVFFIQKRIGKHGNTFNIYKLRSMKIHENNNVDNNPKNDRDPRITKFGRVMRKLRIDELPQFINIIKGDMNLIGPRPEQAPLVNKYTEEIPYYNKRHNVRPGVTGWAQINYSYGANTYDTIHKLQYDLYYIKNQSFFLDFKIFLKTFKIVLGFKGQ